ncbi:hypothetical protein N9B73_01430 [Verrucomicrobiales bacterium]|nr:hypothetical protein [Verrucomicrobiales bacterium]
MNFYHWPGDPYHHVMPIGRIFPPNVHASEVGFLFVEDENLGMVGD